MKKRNIPLKIKILALLFLVIATPLGLALWVLLIAAELCRLPFTILSKIAELGLDTIGASSEVLVAHVDLKYPK